MQYTNSSLIKRIQFESFGNPDVLEVAEIPLLNLQESSRGQLLIKVLACGVNPIDAKIREGSSFVSKNLTLPAGLGFDLCGKVIQCSNDISHFTIGDIVFGAIGRSSTPCAYSEYCLVNAKDMTLKPNALNYKDASALPIAGLTAWQALYNNDINLKDKRILIHAGAGGVGHLTIQLAKHSGAYVITTASKKHHEFLTSLKVDEIIDYTKEDFEEVLNPIDLVIDLVGGDVGVKSLNILKENGLLVTVPTITHDVVLKAGKKMKRQVKPLLIENNSSDLQNLANLVVENKIKVKIAAEFPLEAAKEAHYLLEKKQTQGKIILIP